MKRDSRRSFEKETGGANLSREMKWKGQAMRLARFTSQSGVLFHTGLSGSSIVGVGLLNILSGTDAFFVHGTDQDEDIRIVFQYEWAFESLNQIVAVFFVEIRFGQVNRAVVRVDGLTFIGDCFDSIGRVFIGDFTSFTAKTARVKTQLVTGDGLAGIDNLEIKSGAPGLSGAG